MDYFKLAICSAIFLTTLLSGLLMIRANHRLQSLQWLYYLDRIGGGLLLGLALFYFFPEGAQHLAQYFAVPIWLITAILLVWLIILFIINVPQKQNTSIARTTLFGKVLPQYTVSILLALVLCTHAFTEGIVIGIGLSIIGITGFIMAIFCHKASEAFVLVYYSGQNKIQYPLQVLSLIIFALMTPLGISLSDSMGNIFENSGGLWSGFFDLFAGFLFAYLSYSCRCRFLKDKINKKWGISLFAAGFALMGLMGVWA
jgi:zinc transporter ZupT